MTAEPVLSIRGVRKQYNALRPLRINQLDVAPGERVALSGLDAGAAEVFVNLVTGASVPDEGDVRVQGQSTAAIADGISGSRHSIDSASSVRGRCCSTPRRCCRTWRCR